MQIIIEVTLDESQWTGSPERSEALLQLEHRLRAAVSGEVANTVWYRDDVAPDYEVRSDFHYDRGLL